MEKIKVTGKKIKAVEIEIRDYLKVKELDKYYDCFRFIKACTGEEIIPDADYQIIINVQQGSNEGFYIFISTLNYSYKLSDWFMLRFNCFDIENVLKVQNELIKALEL
ncbi:hypothetical protein LGK97_08215 [Clostridium sp. CS001]|uniref:hypothetical protein n=1 Tax=Clostridium sp. CS001 TaxID=2880648 RepID=UPI001CF24476|nr:hypothetical protein [Clostridium sp. CS001]MCB2289748.1 hypothetical protein [Clostridium sp. CS001]